MVAPIVGCHVVEQLDAKAYDRRWLLVDEQGHWLSDVALASVRLAVSHGHLVIRAPGMLRLDIPLDVIEDDDSVQMQATIAGQWVSVVDEGDLVAVWFSNLLGQPCRLVKIHPDCAVPAF